MYTCAAVYAMPHSAGRSSPSYSIVLLRCCACVRVCSKWYSGEARRTCIEKRKVCRKMRLHAVKQFFFVLTFFVLVLMVHTFVCESLCWSRCGGVCYTQAAELGMRTNFLTLIRCFEFLCSHFRVWLRLSDNWILFSTEFFLKGIKLSF